MRTRTRFAILFACIGIAVMAIGVAAIYEAVGLDSARRVPAEAEALLGAAAKRALDPELGAAARLEGATESLIAARSLLAEARVLAKDAVVRLALEVAAILAAVLATAAVAFYLLSRLITKGLDGLAAGALAVQGEMSRRFPRSSDPDLDAVAKALNDLLDLAAEQERRLGEAARLEGWREVASFLAHQLKNPLAAVLLAAENGSLALGEPGPGGGIASARLDLARESSRIARAEAERLRALIDRFRDLAPAGLDAYGSSGEVDLPALLADCASRAERSGASVSILGIDSNSPHRDPRERIAGDPSGSKVADDPSGPKVAGDRGLLEQALWNLFSNSIEAGEGGGASVSIYASIGISGKEAIVLVQDSNRGIDPAIVSRLGRERISTKTGGTGLGLILVRRILAAQGGSLELFATESGGLGARVSLPLAERKIP